MKQATYPNRTQISLSNEIKTDIESRASLHGESLSEYLRKAALIRMALEDNETTDLHSIAVNVVGTIDKDKSGWKTVKDIAEWQKQERHYEDSHRS